MNKYPPLVEQAYSLMLKKGHPQPKEQIFKTLVNEGMLNSDGTPTDQAIERGWVGQADPNDPIAKFKLDNPLFSCISDKHFFIDDDGEVMIDAIGTKKVAEMVLDDPNASDEAKGYAIGLLNEINNY